MAPEAIARGRRLVLAAGLLALVASPAAAQGRRVMLRIRPRTDDTLRTRFTQVVEMVGTMRRAGVDTTLTTRISTLLLSRVLVEGRDPQGTLVVTITDSVAVDAEGARRLAPTEAARRAMEGARVRLRIAPDGAATLLGHPDAAQPELEAVAAMPATLPEHPVPVGGVWEKVMGVPVTDRSIGHGTARLRAIYRLDSLSADGSAAFISMRGTFTRDSTAAPLHGLTVRSSGRVTGMLRVDRRRGWWSDSKLTIVENSTLTPTDGDARPMRVRTTIHQEMHTTPRR